MADTITLLTVFFSTVIGLIIVIWQISDRFSDKLEKGFKEISDSMNEIAKNLEGIKTAMSYTRATPLDPVPDDPPFTLPLMRIDGNADINASYQARGTSIIISFKTQVPAEYLEIAFQRLGNKVLFKPLIYFYWHLEIVFNTSSSSEAAQFTKEFLDIVDSEYHNKVNAINQKRNEFDTTFSGAHS